MPGSVSIAIVQKICTASSPEGSIQQACDIIASCGAQGAQLVVFGECWLGGYPAWIDHARDYATWDQSITKSLFRDLHARSIALDSPEMQELCQCAAKHHLVICMGLNEIAQPSTGTIYNSYVIIDADGKLVGHHRKLMPTHTERLIYGLGDGHGLSAVDTQIGRVGALICWEHWMPLARQAMHDSAEEIHIALWPQVHDLLQVSSRHYAFEGRCFVIAAGQTMRQADLPGTLTYLLQMENTMVLNGGSALIAPNGEYLLNPQFGGPDIIYTGITDLDMVLEEKMSLDVSGHFQRKDIFQFKVEPNK